MLNIVKLIPDQKSSRRKKLIFHRALSPDKALITMKHQFKIYPYNVSKVQTHLCRSYKN
jgi:hypothetical protein